MSRLVHVNWAIIAGVFILKRKIENSYHNLPPFGFSSATMHCCAFVQPLPFSNTRTTARCPKNRWYLATKHELPRHTPSRQQVAINSVEMQTECPDPNRRKLMQTVLASTMLILLPRNASAKTGESAKLSIFGVEGLSSPFTADLKSQGEPLYKNLNEEEMSRYTRAITDGRTSLSKIPEFVSEKSWEDVKSAIRQRVADLRTAQRRLMAAISEQNIRKKAEKIYDNFKKSIEEIDLAAKQKNGDKTLQAQKQAMKYLQEWASVAGLNI